jgi:hypothetical protein
MEAGSRRKWLPDFLELNLIEKSDEMKKFIFCLAIAFISTLYTAQGQRKKHNDYQTAQFTDGAKMEYRIMDADPGRINNWYMTFNAMGLESSRSELMSAELNVKAFIKPWLLVRTGYSLPYFDAARHDALTLGSNLSYHVPIYSNLDAGVTLMPFSFEKDVPLTLPITAVSGYGYPVVYNLKMSVPKRFALGVRGGYQLLRRSSEYGILSSGMEQDWYAFTSANNFYGGVSLITMRHTAIILKDGNIISRDVLGQFYADLVYGASMQGKFYNPQTHDITTDPSRAYTHSTKVGYRAGVNLQFQSTHSFGYTGGLEYGIPPTFNFAETPFVTAKAGIYFMGRIKK